MRLEFIQIDKLAIDKANMRHGKRSPDVSDLLPTVRKRGVLQTLLVRASAEPGHYEIVAGRRRYHAACIVAGERRAAAANDNIEPDPQDTALPCAILDEGDDAAAIEASLIENVARLDPDDMTRWVTFTRLVKEGQGVEDIAATFGLPELAVRRILALGNLLPRIRDLHAQEAIDRATVRLLTMASKRQQQDWLRLVDDPEQRAPTGQALKAWLTGGQTIAAKVALFDVGGSGLATIADLFGEDRYFVDPEAFWLAQNAAIAARAEACRASGWSEVVVLEPGNRFHGWEHDKTPKRKGGRVYIEVRATGEVAFHEGYVSRREREAAQRKARGEDGDAKPARAEVTSALGTYIDLHRHAVARAALTDHPGVALRLMVAHAIAGSPLWSVRLEPQSARDEGTRESVACSVGEGVFDTRRRAVLDLLGFRCEHVTVAGGCGDDLGRSGDRLTRLFLRLLELPDAAVLDVVAVVMGETLCVSSPVVDAVGLALRLDMADWWEADPALFELIRDREVLAAIVAEVAGPRVASANVAEKGKTLKKIVTDHLAGAEGRTKFERWVPGWLRFPPAAYTKRGGVGSVAGHARVAAELAAKDAQGRGRDAPETGAAAATPEGPVAEVRGAPKTLAA